MRPYRRTDVKWITFLLVLAAPAAAQAAGDDSQIPFIERSGDLLQVGIPLAALGLTYLLDNGPPADVAGDAYAPVARGGFDFTQMTGSPRHDLALAIARTELMTYSLKYGIDAERPNGGSESFPSGHTSVAFAGAEFIRKQYGLWVGIPAYLTAGYVGWSRVISNNHYPRDVLAGATIGILANHDVASLRLPFGTLNLSSGLLTPTPGYFSAFDAPPVDSVAEKLAAPPSAAGLRLTLTF